jgi:hypothetical protein
LDDGFIGIADFRLIGANLAALLVMRRSNYLAPAARE